MKDKEIVEAIKKDKDYLWVIEDAVDRVDTKLNWVLLMIVIIFIISISFVFLNINFEDNSALTPEDYCDEKFGEDYYYNLQKGKPQNIRSCDIIINNSIETNYYSLESYNNWKERKKIE